MNELIFPDSSLCSAVRFAHRAHGGAVLPGNGDRRKTQLAEKPATAVATNAAFFGSFLGSKKERSRKPRWRKIQQQQWRQTQPLSVPFWAAERNAPVNPLWQRIPQQPFLPLR